MFAACAKKPDPLTYEKTKPKAEGAADTSDGKNKDQKVPPPAAPRNDNPADSNPTKKNDNEVSTPDADTSALTSNGDDANKGQPAKVTVPPAPSSGAPAPEASSAPAKQDAKPQVAQPTEECLIQKVTEYTHQLKAEESEITSGSLNWVVQRSKQECRANNLQDQETLKRVQLKLKEVALELFAEATDVIMSYMSSLEPKPIVVVPKEKILSTTEYHFESVRHSGSRNFFQPKEAINYSISKIQRTINITTTTGDMPPVSKKTTDSTQKYIFSSVSSFSFGLELKPNKTYTLDFKDDTGELALDYGFTQGSVEGLKKGDSAKIALTKAAWLKAINFETQKIIAKYYSDIPRSSLRILLSPLDPPSVRGCNIGKGYFLGSHAIECSDPEYRVRIQVLDANSAQ
tara:strand:+ start:9658 stop:10863 length:1206 start_codon:yes stop_codon:yes gene_type:complete